MLDGIFAGKLFCLTSCTIHFRNHVVHVVLDDTTVVSRKTGNLKKWDFFP
jgi:hypothetical protein